MKLTKSIIYAFTCAALSVSSVSHATNSKYSKKKKPNIIVIMADDFGVDASSLYTVRTGADDPSTTDVDEGLNAPTPALATLASQGVLFKNGWAMPACSTTRGTRSTGKLPSTTGMGFPLGGRTPRVAPDITNFLSPFVSPGEEFPPTMLNPNDPNLIQKVVRDAGYATAKFGKWHEIQAPGGAGGADVGLSDIEISGFDTVYAQLGGGPGGGYGGSASLQQNVPDTWAPTNNLGAGPTSEFIPSSLISNAVQFIDSANDEGKPYYISLDFAAPHFPYEVAPGPNEPQPADFQGEPGDWLTLDPVIHADVIKQVSNAFSNGGAYPAAGTPVGPGTQAPEVITAKSRAAFKSLVAYMDVQIGRLLENVDLSNTYVIFAGDNGTQGAGFNPAFNAVEPPQDDRRSKVTLYRNGVEVPFIVAGPVRWKGRVSKSMVSTTDIYATVLDIAGLRQPRDTYGESISFERVLKGYRGKRRFNVAELYSARPINGGSERISAGGLLAGPSNPFPQEGRVVANTSFRLLAKPQTVAVGGGVVDYVCQDNQPSGLLDCYNNGTGVFEKKLNLEFYDIRNDPSENDALVFDEMNRYQYRSFLRLCYQMNKVSRKATFFQNGKACDYRGENLIDIDPA